MADSAPRRLVIDTHWLLDLWLFEDPRARALATALDQGAVIWLASLTMRQEVARVLDYPALQRVRQARGMTAAALLARFDQHARLQPEPPASPWRCRDPDDQVFIDLAWAHQAHLLSRDRAVLALAPVMARAGLQVSAHWPTDQPAKSAS